MPRKKLIRQNHFPYHVVSRCNNKDWFTEPLNIIWSLFIDSLILANTKCPVMIHSFVLMSNHYHLMITTPHNNIDRFMFFLNLYFSKKLRRKTKRINHQFSGRYSWSIIDSKNYLFQVYRYIYQNPIRANIVSNCQEYPFSSIHWELKPKIAKINLYSISDYKIKEMMTWLDEKIKTEKNDLIKRNLKRSYYSKSIKFEKIHPTNNFLHTGS